MKKYLLILLVLLFINCKKDNIQGIKINTTFLENQSLSENRKLDTIINKTLKGDWISLRRLNHFPCGESSGCYDKGFVITQIIYKIGEPNFIKMVRKLDQKELYGIEDYIRVGLEYGDNNYDGKMDNKNSENEFPHLMKLLSEK